MSLFFAGKWQITLFSLVLEGAFVRFDGTTRSVADCAFKTAARAQYVLVLHSTFVFFRSEFTTCTPSWN